MAEPARGPGRPPSGARERVLEAAIDVLKSDGYAGLTTAKVAARSGQNKALIAYHFGSKQGLVSAAASEVAESITTEVLSRLEQTGTPEAIVRGVLDGLWGVLERDEALARVYFDLAAAAMAEPEARATMQAMRALWRSTAERLLAGAGMSARDAEAASVATIATLDGLALEWLDRGDTKALARARERIVRGICG